MNAPDKAVKVDFDISLSMESKFKRFVAKNRQIPSRGYTQHSKQKKKTDKFFIKYSQISKTDHGTWLNLAKSGDSGTT